jgi:hypothetical protein
VWGLSPLHFKGGVQVVISDIICILIV